MCEQRIADEEIVYLRIPDGSPWREPPNRITSANFKLNHKRGDLGLSVYRDIVVTSADVLAKPGVTPGCFLAAATVGKIRELKDGAGNPRCLDVIAVDDEDDPGHAEIRGPEPGKFKKSVPRALCDLFKRI